MDDPDDAARRMVLEPVAPDASSYDTKAMARGEPGLPHRFLWRETRYEVASVPKTWKVLSPGTFGGRDRYVRRHYYEVATTCGSELRLYADRGLRPGGQRWWLHSIRGPASIDA
ncbi:MAG: DUF6504 family protein [Planctomycetota bacterium]|jgi:phosphoribosylglycinamide formyltransferase-1